MMNSKWFLVLAAGACFSCAASPQGPSNTLASAASCQELAKTEQVVANLYAPGHVYAAEPLKTTAFHSRTDRPVRLYGASLYTRAEPGMTGPYMERALRCHAAYGRATHPNDPLHPAEGEVNGLVVEAVDGSYAIHIRGNSYKTGNEILQRAHSLSGQSTSIQAEQVGAANTQHGNL